MTYDWSSLALFAVIGLGMTTSATLFVRTVVTTLRQPVRRDTEAACSC